MGTLPFSVVFAFGVFTLARDFARARVPLAVAAGDFAATRGARIFFVLNSLAGAAVAGSTASLGALFGLPVGAAGFSTTCSGIAAATGVSALGIDFSSSAATAFTATTVSTTAAFGATISFTGAGSALFGFCTTGFATGAFTARAGAFACCRARATGSALALFAAARSTAGSAVARTFFVRYPAVLAGSVASARSFACAAIRSRRAFSAWSAV